MNSLWWLALPILALPVWWHRQKREQVRAEPLATARFLPRAEPKQLRVWLWRDRVLLLVRCLLLACLVAWLADPVVPWRGDTVLVVAGSDNAWAERQIGEAGLGSASRVTLPPHDALRWLGAHAREWRADARLLVVGDVPMPAVQPQFGHRVELRTLAKPPAKAAVRVAIVGERTAQWGRLFEALDVPQRFVLEKTPNDKTELVIWDSAQVPPAGLRAPLWWVADATAFPELRTAKEVDGLRFADSQRGRLWSAAAWPPKDADSARKLFETWQQLHYPPVAFTAPSQVLPAGQGSPGEEASGALRDILMMVLVALFALERVLTHVRRS